jgi:hypothetical protein
MVEPVKKRKGLFPELRKKGKIGEEKIDAFLKQNGYNILSLRFEAPCDECDKIQNWRKFTKLPEGIARKDNEVFFYESKFKTEEKFYVNVRDYNLYLKFSEILPIKIFFYVEKTNSIFVHDVASVAYPEKFMYHDKNRVYDLKNYVRRLTFNNQAKLL